MQKYKKTVVTEHFVIKATRANLEKLFGWVKLDVNKDFLVMMHSSSKKEPVTLLVGKDSYLVYNQDPEMYAYLNLVPEIISGEMLKKQYKKIKI